MAFRAPTATVNAFANLYASLVDAGPGPGYFELRTGAQPASANDAASGTLLATATVNDPAFAAAVAGVIGLDVAPSVTGTGVAAGTAGWFRMYDSAGATVSDGSVTGIGGGGQIEMATTTVSIGLVITATAGSVTAPAA